MNDTLNVIKSRRSTRKFKSTPIGRDIIEAIIEAGLYAPSAHNKQTWHFTVIQNADLIKDINRDAKDAAKAHPDAVIQKIANNETLDIFYGAPTLIVVSGDNHGLSTREDCAAATQNMLLAAESLSIGSCWNGIVSMMFNHPNYSDYPKKLGLPVGYSPLYVVALGEKAVASTHAPARKEGTVHYIDATQN